jgi:dihydrofolate reductase
MVGNHRLIIIVAVDNNWAIGKDNDLLYSVPTDMKFFREKTKENIVMYGYSTLVSFPNGKPLPKRDNIVLTSNVFETPDNLKIAHSIDEAFDIIRNMDDTRDVFVCGGASIYRQLIDFCDMAYITKINASTDDATAFMVNLDKKENWVLVDAGESIKDESSNLELSFNTYRRVG